MKQYSRNRILGSLLAGALTLTLVLPAGAALVRRTMEIDAGLSVYVGDTALVETTLGSHIHFSVTHQDEPMNPADFLALGE